MDNITISKATLDDLDEIYNIDTLSFPIPWSKESIKTIWLIEHKCIFLLYILIRLSNFKKV